MKQKTGMAQKTYLQRIQKRDKLEERVWEKISASQEPKQLPHARLKSRDIFTYALHLYLNNKNMERIEILMQVAQKMQVPGGQFRRWWKDQNVRDLNVVEFCMRDATLLYREFGDKIQATSLPAWKILRKMLRSALKACLRHRVPEKHTNICLLNALNLMQLGQIFKDDKALTEGHFRFNQFCIYTYEWGIHEYTSPTYTPIQESCLELFEEYGTNEKVRCQASKLRELFQKIKEQFIISPKQRNTKVLHEGPLAQTTWDYSDQILGPISRIDKDTNWLEGDDTPARNIRQSWGTKRTQTNTTFIHRDISLSSSQAGYDYPRTSYIPLVVDLLKMTTSNNSKTEWNALPLLVPTICYFIPGVQHTPYDRKATRHAPVLWAAAQDESDVLGMVLYEPGPYKNLESCFVMPIQEGIKFIVGEKTCNHITLKEICNHEDRENQYSQDLATTDTLFLYHEETSVVIGIRIIDPRNVKGGQATINFYHDKEREEYKIPESKIDRTKEIIRVTNAKEIPALKLSVLHHQLDEKDHKLKKAPWSTPRMGIWVRVGTNIAEESLAEWCEKFAQEPVKIEQAADLHYTKNSSPRNGIRHLHVKAQHKEGEWLELDIKSQDARHYTAHIHPEPSKALLKVDDVCEGRPILEDLPLIQDYNNALKEYEHKITTFPYIWEAEDGRIWHPMQFGEDRNVSSGQYVWLRNTRQTRQRSGTQIRSSDVGSVTWRLELPQDDQYTIWARVRTPNQKKGAYHVRIYKDNAMDAPLELATWNIDVQKDWQWVPMDLRNLTHVSSPTTLALKQGPVNVQLFSKKSGIQIDQLFITNKALTPFASQNTGTY
ncbi:MAG: hypothetical protein ACI8V2_002624 [Candidatus Latescibacterota bacterium]|jgi:hypothetical protein